MAPTGAAPEATADSPFMEINLFRNARDAVDLEAGQVLFHEGEPGDSMFAVAEGRVELAHKGKVVDTIGPGGILGEMALIDAVPRSATATATRRPASCGSTRSTSRTSCRSTRRSRSRS